ncbi:hypothetical protein CKAH01_09751 [Colletotrichum kahawae]|uniref:Uncharacterized protein n=1 Tax=Colletotrichum kahawae TaxID=34407 RepID=A0AAE0CZU5_COLKA|nr:hypothetical protein CKAH01_09751 [Colletotrichum kahawae]
MEEEQRMGMGKEEDRNGMRKAKKAWLNCWKSGAIDCLGWKNTGTVKVKGWAGLGGDTGAWPRCSALPPAVSTKGTIHDGPGQCPFDPALD